MGDREGSRRPAEEGEGPQQQQQQQPHQGGQLFYMHQLPECVRPLVVAQGAMKPPIRSF